MLKQLLPLAPSMGNPDENLQKVAELQCMGFAADLLCKRRSIAPETFGFFEKNYVAQDDLELAIFLPQFSKCWDYRCAHSAGTEV
jgi:hypothetical protein